MYPSSQHSAQAKQIGRKCSKTKSILICNLQLAFFHLPSKFLEVSTWGLGWKQGQPLGGYASIFHSKGLTKWILPLVPHLEWLQEPDQPENTQRNSELLNWQMCFLWSESQITPCFSLYRPSRAQVFLDNTASPVTGEFLCFELMLSEAHMGSLSWSKAQVILCIIRLWDVPNAQPSQGGDVLKFHFVFKCSHFCLN